MAHSTNLGSFKPLYEVIDVVETAKISKIVKKVNVNGVWEDRVFIVINERSERANIDIWLKEHYGSPVYGQTWWTTFTSVCMMDKIYTHWMLCK